MPQFIRIFLNKFKEYIILIILLIFSLILITLNENSKVKNVRMFTIGLFASVNSSVLSLSRIFEDNAYIESLEMNNADLMLQINQLRNYGLENNQLNEILSFRSTSNFDFVTESFTFIAGIGRLPFFSLSYRRCTPVVVSSLIP